MGSTGIIGAGEGVLIQRGAGTNWENRLGQQGRMGGHGNLLVDAQNITTGAGQGAGPKPLSPMKQGEQDLLAQGFVQAGTYKYPDWKHSKPGWLEDATGKRFEHSDGRVALLNADGYGIQPYRKATYSVQSANIPGGVTVAIVPCADDHGGLTRMTISGTNPATGLPFARDTLLVPGKSEHMGVKDILDFDANGFLTRIRAGVGSKPITRLQPARAPAFVVSSTSVQKV